jgi:rubredoxin
VVKGKEAAPVVCEARDAAGAAVVGAPCDRYDSRFYANDEWPSSMSNDQLRTWMCLICGWIYDEAAGRPEDGIAPGTRWEDVPVNWTCPECGARKEDFELVEI